VLRRTAGLRRRSGLTRRRMLASGGLVSAAVLLISEGEADAAVVWKHHVSATSGASISYPANWALDTYVHTQLLYPDQSFAIRSGPRPRGCVGDLPDLSTYRTDSIFLWLLHYDGLQNAVDCPIFRPVSSYTQLEERISEFIQFSRYGADFSGNRRSYVMRLWVGSKFRVAGERILINVYPRSGCRDH
jgi:hypothetical protein